MFCILALIVFSILGIFSVTHRPLAKEALDCVFRRITLRPCNTGFKEKIKSKILVKLLNRSTFIARIFNQHFELLSWIFVILMIGSTFWVIKGGYNYYFYGSCNGLNKSGFCAFDPKGDNNKITGINAQCGIKEVLEKNVSLNNVDLSTSPTKNVGSKNTVVFIGCYECDYSRKAYQDIQKLVKERKTNYIFAHYPAKENTNYLSEVGYCVFKEYNDKFWLFNDYLFTVDKAKSFEQEHIEIILKNFGFDVDKINKCIDSQETKNIVEKQLVELKKTNLYGTPTVFINGQSLVGPKPYRVYDWEIIKPW
ncbi:thioredoxin domain-containing protein [Patescibacteria group bacterium]|nr:thioredoxin domain-containing protein [Patescibacteria group bacterium]MBU0879191.1 thioredoxin domain-containing protein [Patescibacteria group bacterium]MBU0880087.1 thioredoxin domain-containing protein [Patescibacteria group bacterium]MBU1783631.1 thioredoxin domain-containing protein [Patescibacteria group bacterium]MBU1991764.1 thioredoxin domain-containing protein [Patescibacteria group bacterium]